MCRRHAAADDLPGESESSNVTPAAWLDHEEVGGRRLCPPGVDTRIQYDSIVISCYFIWFSFIILTWFYMNLHVVGPCLTFQMGRKFQGSKWHDSSETGCQTGIIHFITNLFHVPKSPHNSLIFIHIHTYIYINIYSSMFQNLHTIL